MLNRIELWHTAFMPLWLGVPSRKKTVTYYLSPMNYFSIFARFFYNYD